MVNSVVARATSDMLIGPDWAMNIEICDMLNHDPGQVKDVVKGIKKRLGSKNGKVQLLALTLLETIVKNCGDIVHMQVAEKGLLHDMVKIVKKKPDFRVKEKILILIDTWQEAFGGPRARYPQYYAAYHELLRSGAVFPQRPESSAPVFTPPQTQPLSSYPPNLRNLDRNQQDGAETSAEAEFPTLSLTEIQNARGIMDVLSEMLNACEPGNKEAIRQEVIVDLVDQCRTYKQRVVHLVNSTADESLLCQGLALNDDLQRLLARHESISSGTPIAQKPKSESTTALVEVDRPLIDTVDNSKQAETKATSNAGEGSQTLNQLLLPTTNGPAPPVKVEPSVDLLSGDFNSPKAENSMALVPLGGEKQPNTPAASEQNALVLFDMFSDGNNASNPANPPPINPNGQPHPPASQFQQQPASQFQQQPNLHSPQGGMYLNGNAPNMGSPHYEQSMYMQGPGSPWNGQITQQQPQQMQQPPSPGYGSQTTGAFPPPPWEAQSTDDGSPVAGSHYPQSSMQVTTQVIVSHGHVGGHPPGSPQAMGSEVVGIGMYIQPMGSGHMPAMNNHVNPNNQLGMHPQQIPGMQNIGMLMPPQHSQANQMTPYNTQQMYGNHNQYNNTGYGYGQPQQPSPQYLEQQMYGMSIRDDSSMSTSSSQASGLSSYLPPMKPANKPEDKLFGDLVDIAKFKPGKSTPGRAGSM